MEDLESSQNFANTENDGREKLIEGSEGYSKDEGSETDRSRRFEEYEEYWENVVLAKLERDGLLSKIKGEICRYLWDTVQGTKEDLGEGPKLDRLNPKVMTAIYDYLQWAGLRGTVSMLLSEVPINFDLVISEEDVEPKLVSLLKTDVSESENHDLVPEGSIKEDDSSFIDEGNEGDTEVKSVQENQLVRNDMDKELTRIIGEAVKKEEKNEPVPASMEGNQNQTQFVEKFQPLDLLTGSPLKPTEGKASSQSDNFLQAFLNRSETKVKEDSSKPVVASKSLTSVGKGKGGISFTSELGLKSKPDEPKSEAEHSSTSVSVPKEKSFFSTNFKYKDEESSAESSWNDSQKSEKKSENAKDLKATKMPEESPKKLDDTNKTEDTSTSENISLDLDLEEEIDTTQDVSLASAATGMSSCDHYVSLEKDKSAKSGT